MPTRSGFKRRAFELPAPAFDRLRDLARFYRAGHSRVVDYALYRLDTHVHSLTHHRDRRSEQRRLAGGPGESKGRRSRLRPSRAGSSNKETT